MAPKDPKAPAEFGRANLSQSLVVIDPGSKELTRTNLVAGTPVQKVANAGGRVWIANGREVRIVSGRAVVN
jgi:hypothetical protein